MSRFFRIPGFARTSAQSDHVPASRVGLCANAHTDLRHMRRMFWLRATFWLVVVGWFAIVALVYAWYAA